jgi:hypothetical protein
LIKARATARFDGGRGNELLIQVYKTTNPAYDCAIKNLAMGGKEGSPLCTIHLQRNVPGCGVHGRNSNNEPNHTKAKGCDHVETSFTHLSCSLVRKRKPGQIQHKRNLSAC